jgi:acyl-coenzyme A synthetase/AMP-(fatty) acid ligase
VYAAPSIGAIVTTIDPMLGVSEIRDRLRNSGACWLVTTDDLHDEKLRAAADATDVIETYLIGTRAGRPAAMGFDLLRDITGAEYFAPPATQPVLRMYAAPAGQPQGGITAH